MTTAADGSVGAVKRLDPPAVPRVLPYLRVKRNLPLAWKSYGHWWIEVDATESYGWWPARGVGLVRSVRGTPGVLNGIGCAFGGTPTRDPNHGVTADYEFSPVLTMTRSDEEVRDIIRRFAVAFSGEWRWSTHPTMNCRLFQLAMFDVVGLVDGTGNYRSRGSGCPALAPVRRTIGQVTGVRRWPRNLPPPGAPSDRVVLDAATTGAPERRPFGSVASSEASPTARRRR